MALFSQVNFDKYGAILTFVNINRRHWKLLVSKQKLDLRNALCNFYKL